MVLFKTVFSVFRAIMMHFASPSMFVYFIRYIHWVNKVVDESVRASVILNLRKLSILIFQISGTLSDCNDAHFAYY